MKPSTLALRAAWLAIMTVPAGCGTLDRAGPGGSAQELLAFYRYAGALAPDARRQEMGNFRNWVRPGHCGPDRLRLGMLAIHTEAGSEEVDAAAILAPCLGAEERPPRQLRNLAHLLEDQLRRRQRLEKRITRLATRRDELEKRLEKAERKRKGLAEERSRLQNRIESLEEQIEALKDIDRSIRQRD